MPIYEYACDRCSHEFEKLVFSGDDTDIVCPECHSPDISKKMSAVSFMGKSIGTCASDAPKGFS